MNPLGHHICVLLAVSATAAHADPMPAVAAALDRFQSACATALSDPEAYIASLTIPGPAGEPVLANSPDGQVLFVHTAQSEGLTDYGEFSGLSDRLIRRCSISAIIPDYPDAPEIDAALKPLLDAAATEIVGGTVDQIAPFWEPGGPPTAFEGEPWFIYHASSLLPGIDTVAVVAIQNGGVDFSAEHIVTAEAAQ